MLPPSLRTYLAAHKTVEVCACVVVKVSMSTWPNSPALLCMYVGMLALLGNVVNVCIVGTVSHPQQNIASCVCVCVCVCKWDLF